MAAPRHLLAVFIVLAAVLTLAQAGTTAAQTENAIQELVNLLAGQQQVEEQDYTGLKPQKIAGIFPSYVHMYVRSRPLRNAVKFFDNNMFVTNWVVQALLEALPFLKDVDLGAVGSMVGRGVQACVRFHDRNDVHNETSAMNFWLMKRVNDSDDHFMAWPENIFQPIQDGNSLVDKINHILHTHFPELSSPLFRAFGIPADFDDTSVNLVLGALLSNAAARAPKKASDPISRSLATWRSQPYNNDTLAATMRLYARYAYRPYSANKAVNFVDPRTYYWVHRFLHDPRHAGTRDWAFITTWVQDSVEVRTAFYNHHSMPFNTNNVDASVVANSLLAITRAVLGLADGGGAAWFDADLQHVYRSSATLVAWLLEEKTTLMDRPDLLLVYYPPRSDFFWFVSRTVSFLRDAFAGPLPAYITPEQHATLAAVRTMLEEGMQHGGTQLLQQLAVPVRVGRREYVAWDEFLGEGDLIKHHDDRVFSTAVSVNALLDTWAQAQDGSLALLPATPPAVVELLQAGVRFLADFATSRHYEKENAFFSGSMKGLNSLPFAYPSNAAQFLNGTRIDPSTATLSAGTEDNMTGVRGVIPDATYADMVANKTWYSRHTPTTFGGYDKVVIPFPYWSAPCMTHAAALLALAKASAAVPPSPAVVSSLS